MPPGRPSRHRFSQLTLRARAVGADFIPRHSRRLPTGTREPRSKRHRSFRVLRPLNQKDVPPGLYSIRHISRIFSAAGTSLRSLQRRRDQCKAPPPCSEGKQRSVPAVTGRSVFFEVAHSRRRQSPGTCFGKPGKQMSRERAYCVPTLHNEPAPRPFPQACVLSRRPENTRRVRNSLQTRRTSCRLRQRKYLAEQVPTSRQKSLLLQQEIARHPAYPFQTNRPVEQGRRFRRSSSKLRQVRVQHPNRRLLSQTRHGPGPGASRSLEIRSEHRASACRQE